MMRFCCNASWRDMSCRSNAGRPLSPLLRRALGMGWGRVGDGLGTSGRDTGRLSHPTPACLLSPT